MNYLEKYNLWLNYENLDPSLKEEMLNMTEKEKEEAFTNDLEFGTGGMRGILGAGTNRLNKYIIKKATYGFGEYLLGQNPKASCVIAHDNRHMSKEFALETAKVLASMGIVAYLSNDLRPTPFLSFATRKLGATGGIMITASHNPKEYNGYKIYDADGCQLTPKYADMVIDNINKINDYFEIRTEKNQELIKYIDEDVDNAYVEMVKNVSINNVKKDLKIVYTPLHGTGSVFGPRILTEEGYDIHCVEAQMVHDPNFSSVKSANPEEADAFIESINLGHKIGADLLLATDPDADRVGIAVKHNGEYVLLNGNQTASIVLNYILSTSKKLPENGYVFTTNVSSSLPVAIAKKYNMNVNIVLTGFKFIGEKAKEIEGKGTYVFGFEESYGCLLSDEVRDKDAMQACLIIAEAACYYKEQGKTLVDALNDIFEEYGYYKEGLVNISLKGLEGSKKINEIMNFFRTNDINVKGIVTKEDYKLQEAYTNGETSKIDLPKSNVIKYILDDDSWFVLRPSGTEPKLKVYFGVKGNTNKMCEDRFVSLKAEVMNIVNEI